MRSDAIAPLTPTRAAAVARAELDAFVAQLRALGDADWAKPTVCTGWDVRDVAAHVTGAARESAQVRLLLRDAVTALPHLRLGPVNALNHGQILRGRRQHPSQIIAELARVGPDAVRARQRFPTLLRRVPLPLEPLDGSRVAHLMDVLYPRDMLVHRIDIAQATGRTVERPAHLAVMLEQIVRDLGQRWSTAPIRLHLTGGAGGAWELGQGPPAAEVSVDAIDYVRTLAGRNDEPALSIDGDPTVAHAVRTARVPI